MKKIPIRAVEPFVNQPPYAADRSSTRVIDNRQSAADQRGLLQLALGSSRGREMSLTSHQIENSPRMATQRQQVANLVHPQAAILTSSESDVSQLSGKLKRKTRASDDYESSDEKSDDEKSDDEKSDGEDGDVESSDGESSDGESGDGESGGDEKSDDGKSDDGKSEAEESDGKKKAKPSSKKPALKIGRKPSGTAPNILNDLHNILANDIYEYTRWLMPDANWATRPEIVRKKRLEAIVILGTAVAEYKEAIARKDLKYDEKRKWKRSEALSFRVKKAPEIEKITSSVRRQLSQIDKLVKDPPPPRKTWATFQGDSKDLDQYHQGTPSDPIPVIWYKQESNYEPITIGKKTYKYPNGPKVKGRLKTYKIQVAKKHQFGKDSVFINTKKEEKRTKQRDINYALTQAGASLTGLDGDHVQDLGFGGEDSEINYWPLKANINRRPFLGWRFQYGLNYVKEDTTSKSKKSKKAKHLKLIPLTATLGSLIGKSLKIKSFMAPGDANVPAEGVLPEEESGTE